MTGHATIAILLPTYNGARFLARQLDSLLAQTLDNFVIVTRDDGSTDESCSIVEEYCRNHPRYFHIVESDGRNLGPGGNFSLLMQYVLDHKAELNLGSAYLMLCDQDDVWEREKVEWEFRAMLEAERRYPGQPLIVHSDLQVVAEDETVIADSFLEYQGLVAARNRLKDIVFSNTVTGCTALLNAPLARKALPIPAAAMMHDWWLALVAAAFGQIVFEPGKLVKYRQHGRNTLGATRYIPRKPLSRTTFRELFRNSPNELLFSVAGQARAFADRYGKELQLSDRLHLRLAGGLRSNSLLVQRILFRLLRV